MAAGGRIARPQVPARDPATPRLRARGRRTRPVRTLLPGALAALATACASAAAIGTQSEPLPGEGVIGLGRGEALPAFSPQQSAGANWTEAEKSFGDEDYLIASRFYVYIRRNFPYSKYAALADLRLADCQFERERFREAIDGYQSFLRLHPTHPQLPYALYKAARAHYELIPSELFIFPPSYEKDQTEVRDAAKALLRYVERYPDHEHVEDAKLLLSRVRTRLMAHERYVADFYERLGKLRGYVGRLERIRREYADVALDPELMLEIVTAYARLEDREKAGAALADFEERFPEAEEKLAKARARVAAIPPEPEPSADPDSSADPAEDDA